VRKKRLAKLTATINLKVDKNATEKVFFQNTWVKLCCFLGLLVIGGLPFFSVWDSQGSLSINSVDSVHSSYSDLQEFSKSPLCGCKNDLFNKLWRGVLFSASEIRIERFLQSLPDEITPNENYGFLITGPAPTDFSDSWRFKIFPELTFASRR
jgi:hypothetical protein